ncbi:MAG: hypothetical protein FWF81_05955, partial [Defluviitaleaceae bacterium]|nr:hypothetical protein [Defluviitaleaceae bacterium]
IALCSAGGAFCANALRGDANRSQLTTRCGHSLQKDFLDITKDLNYAYSLVGIITPAPKYRKGFLYFGAGVITEKGSFCVRAYDSELKHNSAICTARAIGDFFEAQRND